MALAAELHGGVAVLFAAEEPVLDFMPYRQDSDFYYLTGWTEPGAALMIVGDAPQAASPRAYKEILFLPARDLRMEKYTGVKMDAATPGVAEASGVDNVEADDRAAGGSDQSHLRRPRACRTICGRSPVRRGHSADELYRGHAGNATKCRSPTT